MGYIKIKRIIDIRLSIILLIILLPLTLTISIILYIKYKKVIFKQYRSEGY